MNKPYAVTRIDNSFVSRPVLCYLCTKPAEFHAYCECGDYTLCSATCHEIVHGLKHQVNNARKKARSLEVADTLTLFDMVWAVRHFNFLCAYCQKNPSESIDHYIPFFQGGASTADNCVPACIECNHKKEAFTGQALIYMFGRERYNAVLTYLEMQRNRMMRFR